MLVEFRIKNFRSLRDEQVLRACYELPPRSRQAMPWAA